MQGLRAAIVLLGSLIAANVVLWFVLTNNQAAGVYPPEADSLGIPLMSTAFTSLLVYVAIGAALSLPKTKRFWFFVSAIPAVLAVLLSLALALSWADSNHYLVSVAFAFVSALCGWAWWSDSRLHKKGAAPC